MGKEPPSEVQPAARPDGLEHGLAKHIGGLAFKLALNDTERQVSYGGCHSNDVYQLCISSIKHSKLVCCSDHEHRIEALF